MTRERDERKYETMMVISQHIKERFFPVSSRNGVRFAMTTAVRLRRVSYLWLYIIIMSNSSSVVSSLQLLKGKRVLVTGSGRVSTLGGFVVVVIVCVCGGVHVVSI